MLLAATMHAEFASLEDDAVARLKHGDLNALDVILPRYQVRLYRFLMRIVQDPAAAEDVFQQTWIRVMEKISSYNARRGFDSWLFSIARNLAIDHIRSKRGYSLDAPDESGEALVDRIAAPGPDALEKVLDFERGSIVAAAIGELPAIHREVLILRFEEGMKLEEIAEVVNIPLSTVKSRLTGMLLRTRARLAD